MGRSLFDENDEARHVVGLLFGIGLCRGLWFGLGCDLLQRAFIVEDDAAHDPDGGAGFRKCQPEAFGVTVGVGVERLTLPASFLRHGIKPDRSRRLRIAYSRSAFQSSHHYSHFDKTPAYIAAELSAKEKKLGLWAAENPTNPYEWRKAHR